MTGEREWWEFDPEERPVPLSNAMDAAEAAEQIVEAERQSIIREDTDPTLQTLAALQQQHAPSPAAGDPPKSVLRVALLLLVAGCVGTFSLGWAQGASAQQLVEPTTGARGRSHHEVQIERFPSISGSAQMSREV